MLTRITGEIGNKELDAEVEVEDGKIVLRSHGGGRNPDYSWALGAILSRLKTSNLVPTRVLIDSRTSQKVKDKKEQHNKIIANRSELRGSVDELVTTIGKRAAAYGREEGAKGPGNRNKRILIEVGGATEGTILAVLRPASPMPQIIYFNIGWMKHYAGASSNDPTIGKHSWLKTHEHGLECFNFLPTQNGHVEGYRPPGSGEKVNIDRIGASPSDDTIDEVLVVWLAREPGSGKTLVVGWYRLATVYREAQSGPFDLNGMRSEYSVKTLKQHATLVPVSARSFQVQSSRTAPGAGFGQKPTWYGSPTVDQLVWAYVNDWDNAKKRKGPAGKRPPRNSDPELRRKVEKAAVQHAWQYYEAKYGKGCVESVEPFGRGWDLEVRSGDITWLVEVKGLLNAELVCELTPNEYQKMCSSDHCVQYVVYVVNNALAKEPDAPVPSVFTWKDGHVWQTEDGRELQVVEKVGAVLRCN